MAAMATSAHLVTTVSCSSFAPTFIGDKNVGSVTSVASGVRLPSLKTARGPIHNGRSLQGPSAMFDRGNNTGDGESKKAEKKKFITKEQEPEQYWQTADERDGKNPMASPLPYILILSVLSPFIILAVAFANNWIKIPVR
ncbi:hypothetical protein R1flu_012455 [Riccia fluitans]|uniref:Uncharacterized protein n=1 Tax=Riccia fluitans TaxID=41844 RepID=A0ABD1ZBT8_9MARC